MDKIPLLHKYDIKVLLLNYFFQLSKKHKKLLSFPFKINLIISAHLSRSLKWAFLIKICHLSVVVVVVVSFSHFHLLLKNHWTNFNQIGTKHSWEFKFVQTKGTRSFPKRVYERNTENTFTKFKNLLLKNHWANKFKIWHNAYLTDENSRLCKPRALPFSKGRW